MNISFSEKTTRLKRLYSFINDIRIEDSTNIMYFIYIIRFKEVRFTFCNKASRPYSYFEYAKL
jgi:hypothetical protein